MGGLKTWGGPLLLLAAVLLLGTAVSQSPAPELDQELLVGIQRLSHIPLHQASMVVLYRLTGKGVQPLLVLAALGWLLARRRRHAAALLLASCGGIFIWIDLILKPWFGRARPPEPLLTIDGYSFPSGHAAGAVVFAGTLALLWCRARPGSQPTAWVLFCLWVVLVSWSALVVGAHWPSDIAGGVLMGLAWLGLCLAVWRQHERW